MKAYQLDIYTSYDPRTLLMRWHFTTKESAIRFKDMLLIGIENGGWVVQTELTIVDVNEYTILMDKYVHH